MIWSEFVLDDEQPNLRYQNSLNFGRAALMQQAPFFSESWRFIDWPACNPADRFRGPQRVGLHQHLTAVRWCPSFVLALAAAFLIPILPDILLFGIRKYQYTHLTDEAVI
jgi:hypothetical protein